jgi:hypothetical protein
MTTGNNTHPILLSQVFFGFPCLAHTHKHTHTHTHSYELPVSTVLHDEAMSLIQPVKIFMIIMYSER